MTYKWPLSEVVLKDLSVRGAAPGSLFKSDDCKPFTQEAFSSSVLCQLEELGLQPLHHDTHNLHN